jgi:hypothetical protein
MIRADVPFELTKRIVARKLSQSACGPRRGHSSGVSAYRCLELSHSSVVTDSPGSTNWLDD